jgi:ribosomal protein L7/L12/DNA-binding beta-propeller fold protein YncE
LTQSFNCPSCGAPIDIDAGVDPVVRCQYCSNTVVIPAELRSAPGLTAGAFTGSLDLGDLTEIGPRIQEIIELVHEGEKIDAIKLFRETFGTGLKESKDAVEALERGENIDLTSFSVQSRTGAVQADPVDMAMRIRELLDAGKKIEAIKVYREAAGAGLKESKDVVEAFEAGRPLEFPEPRLTGAGKMIDKAAGLGRAANLVHSGERDEAIRVYRETFDVSQVEGEAAIEKIAAGEIEEVAARALATTYESFVPPPVTIRAKSVAKTAAAAGIGAGCFVWSLLIVILVATILPIFFALSQPGGPLFETWARLNPISSSRITLALGEEGTGPGRFTDPRGIAVENISGRIYVGEYTGGRVQAFDSQGRFTTQWTAGDGNGYMPKLAVDRNGIVYAVVSGEILRYDSETGEYLGSMEVPSGLESQVYFDDAAVTPDGSLVTVSRGETVLRFDPRGQLNLTIPDAISNISEDSELDARVAVDGLGNIFLLGTFNNAVFKYSPQGRFITRFGTDGDEPGQFRAPSAIAVDNNSRVYVTDFKGIQVFDPDGRYLDVIPVSGFAFGLAFDDANQLFVVTNTPRVYRLDTQD